MTRSERFAPGGAPRYIRVYDNGGRSFDRFTVIFSGRYRHKTGGEFMLLGMSSNPFWPQGFGQHSSYNIQVDAPAGWAPAIGQKCHLGTRIPFADLPKDCKILVWQDYGELWDIPIPNEFKVRAERSLA